MRLEARGLSGEPERYSAPPSRRCSAPVRPWLVCANAGTALRDNQIVNASRFIAKLRFSVYLTLTAPRNYNSVFQINRLSQGSFIVNFYFSKSSCALSLPGEAKHEVRGTFGGWK
jgi:hypothetical protein